MLVPCEDASAGAGRHVAGVVVLPHYVKAPCVFVESLKPAPRVGGCGVGAGFNEEDARESSKAHNALGFAWESPRRSIACFETRS